jgi:hypothetical protein
MSWLERPEWGKGGWAEDLNALRAVDSKSTLLVRGLRKDWVDWLKAIIGPHCPGETMREKQRVRGGVADLHVFHHQVEVEGVGVIDDLVEGDELRMLEKLHDLDLLHHLLGHLSGYLRQRLPHQVTRRGRGEADCRRG